ncbi:Gene Transfer Agent (GTA) ORFG06 [Tritonibacter mobilis]|uniref:head-tail connector protein n=1 Tax=Tritonibacter mobilis TaxID=379347 RepID=UPI000F6DACD8|nr:head-tail connector protein [Tritonibacter mobilis]VCU58860.1 Gene Transfer Agent (GTA) ORFG06 [Tritonibacter mobilis]
MILHELTPLPDSILPLAAFKAHLRLGTGFGEEALQDAVLLAFLRASLAAIEARTNKALLTRDYEWRLNAWPRVVELPVAPVSTVSQVALVDQTGAETEVPVAAYALAPDAHAPRLTPRAAVWPMMPSGGGAVIRFTAGMAATWDALPADLAQAVMLLAAHYYEYRDDTSLHAGCMPFGVASLLDRHRMPRLSLSRNEVHS